MITIVLASLVAVLFLANALLYIFPKKEHEVELIEKPNNLARSSIIQFGNSNNSSALAEIKRSLALIEHKLDKNCARIEYAFQRINKLENALSSNGFSLVSHEELIKKVERLEDFRRDALITIEALKDYLKGKQKKKKEVMDKEMEEKIRSLIFRGRPQ